MNLRKKKHIDYYHSQFTNPEEQYQNIIGNKSIHKMSTEEIENRNKDYTQEFQQVMNSIKRNINSKFEVQDEQKSVQDEISQNSIQSIQKKRVEKVNDKNSIKQDEIKIKQRENNENKQIKSIKLYKFKDQPIQQFCNMIEYSSKYPVKPLKQQPQQQIIHFSQHPHSSQHLFPSSPIQQTLINQSIPIIKNRILFPNNTQKSTCKQQIKTHNKLFKKCSYHIAIAYFIHFQKKINSMNVLEVDPTFFSRELQNI